MRILLTGGAGFIGSHLSEALLRAGRDIVVIDSFDRHYPRALKERNLAEVRQTLASLPADSGAKYEFIEGDINVPGVLDRVTCRYPDEFSTVFHLAARPGVRPSLIDPAGYVASNISATVRVLEWARTHAVKNFVFGSSSSVYGNSTHVPFKESGPAEEPYSPYAASKRAAELFCSTYAQLYKLRIASLRFFTVYGRRQRPDLAIRQFAERILSGETITLFGDGQTGRDYTHVSDIVNGIQSAERWLSTQAPGVHEIFNLGRNSAHSLAEMVATVERAVGLPATIARAPMQPGDVLQTWADLEKSQRVLGYQPQMDLQTGVNDMVIWLKQTRAKG